MDKQIFFNCSIPRAGSTLLQNIIGQNPNFHVTPTSGVADLIMSLSATFSTIENFKKEKNYDLCKKSFYNFCKEGIGGYYSTVNKPYVLDKNRIWISQAYDLHQIYHKPKIIVLVRDLRSIFTSYEKKYTKDLTHRYYIETNYNLGPTSSILERIEAYGDNPLEYSLKAIKNIIDYKNPNNLYLARFEDLCANPQRILNEIYYYLEVPSFKHNFTQIDQITYENDNFHLFGDHIIQPQLSLPPLEWDKYLTSEALDIIYEKYKWFFETFNYKK